MTRMQPTSDRHQQAVKAPVQEVRGICVGESHWDALEI